MPLNMNVSDNSLLVKEFVQERIAVITISAAKQILKRAGAGEITGT